MSTGKRIFRWSLMLGLACSLGACFTEIGNSEGEGLVDANFRIEYAPMPVLPRISKGKPAKESVSIDQFYLGVIEGEFHSPVGDEYHLWKEPDPGLPADFTGKDKSAVLPRMKAPPIIWRDLGLECRFSSPVPLEPGRFAFEGFGDRGYIKGTYADAGLESPFLFALPGGSQLELRYPRAMLDRWQAGESYHLEFIFYAAHWLAGASLGDAETILDRNGREVVVLDSLHNPAAYARLRERFLTSFNADSVFFSRDSD